MAVSVRGSGGKAGDLVEMRAWLRGNQRNNKELSYEYRGCNKLLVGGTVSVMAADPWNVLHSSCSCYIVQGNVGLADISILCTYLI